MKVDHATTDKQKKEFKDKIAKLESDLKKEKEQHKKDVEKL